MILNDKQFKHKVKEDGSKCIFFYAGHGEINHDEHRPFKRLGGGQHEKLSNDDLLNQLAEFSEMYPEAYSCYIHTSAQAITKSGFFCKVDLRIKEETKAAAAAGAPAIDLDKERDKIRLEILQEIKIVDLTTDLEHAKKINLENDFMANKLGKVGLEMLKEFGLFQQMQGAPMQGTNEAYQTAEDTDNMNFVESQKYLREKLGDEFICTLAKKVKESIDKGENPNLAEKMKAML